MAVRIGELARRAGVAPSAVRFYEAAGLLPAAERTASGYRVYNLEVLGRLEFIRRARQLGLSLAEIRDLIRANQNGLLRHTVAHKLADVERRSQDLLALRSELESMYVRLLRQPAPECGHLGDCGCWLPTEEEVNAMSAEVKSVLSCDCCDCADCSDPDCGCDCCRPA